MSKILFTQTKLSFNGKRGVIEPDEEGYYELVVGGLNTFNNSGAWYYVAEGARELFGPGSILNRAVANGCLRAEVNHPKQKPGEKDEAFVNRMLSIDLNNTCAHFKAIWLDENFGKNNPAYNNPDLIAIMAKVKPTGPKASILKEALENPNENVCFSIRSVADEGYVRGKRIRVLREVITFDFVNEGGVVIATKWDSPATESIDNSVILEITKEVIEKAKKAESAFATEASVELLQSIEKKCFPKRNTPIYEKW